MSGEPLISDAWMNENRAPKPLVYYARRKWRTGFEVGLRRLIRALIKDSDKIAVRYGGDNRHYVYNGFELAGWVLRRLDRELAMRELRARKLHRILERNSDAANTEYLEAVVNALCGKETGV